MQQTVDGPLNVCGRFPYDANGDITKLITYTQTGLVQGEASITMSRNNIFFEIIIIISLLC